MRTEILETWNSKGENAACEKNARGTQDHRSSSTFYNAYDFLDAYLWILHARILSLLTTPQLTTNRQPHGDICQHKGK